MPFYQKHWEELKRDCDIFPAYSDYLYGPDDRLVVTQEPGLHPLVYPAHPPPPVRYTNSTPSRSWLYKATSRRKQSSSAAHTIQPPIYDCSAGGPSPDGGQFTTVGSLYAHGPKYSMGDTLPTHFPQGARAFYEREKASSQSLSHSHEAGYMNSGILQSTPPVSARVTRQQSQVNNPTKHFTTASRRPPQPSDLRSSSTADIDEKPTHPVTFHQPNTSSPSASLSATYPDSINVPGQHLKDHLARPCGHSPHAYLASHQPNPAASPCPAFDIPMLKTDDILGDPRFLLMQPDKLHQLRAYFSEWWNVANNALDQKERARALMNIQDASNKVHNKLRRLEMEAEQPKQQAQQDQAPKEQETPGMMEEQMNLYHLHQADQLQQLQQMQRSQQLYPQPQPAFSAPQTPSPHQTIYQSPEQPTQSPYYSIPRSSHQQSQQYQPHMASGNLLTSQTHSPSPQQTQKSPHINPAQQLQASDHLRANINRHIPKLWYCLQLVKQAPELLSGATMADQQAAHHWLTSFKQSLPPEGHRYMVEIVSWMYRESSVGRDPLVSMGHTS
ncbi:hypothetical protein DDE83_002833 [Stemphylium lycopersici]|uniref:Uncharacterized protein n=1 Tax=Stemphylium lycopersici TaxID=183478 RepID=A0A364N955_STELY|nr:hypothetical protein DDE83_002833 [Stemphylium lycopersici]